VTTLTYDQAKDVANQSFIAYVGLAGEMKERDFVGDSNASGSSSEQSSNRAQNLHTRLNQRPASATDLDPGAGYEVRKTS
jgi:hypothetical protein